MMEMDLMKIALTRLAKQMLSKTCKNELSRKETRVIAPNAPSVVLIGPRETAKQNQYFLKVDKKDWPKKSVDKKKIGPKKELTKKRLAQKKS